LSPIKHEGAEERNPRLIWKILKVLRHPASSDFSAPTVLNMAANLKVRRC
jgi:hypothetical protein